MTDLLRRLLEAERAPAFALLYRPETCPWSVEVLAGPVRAVDRLADLPLPPPVTGPDGGSQAGTLALVPYRQLAERGFACPDDGTPLLAMEITERERVSLQDLLRTVPDLPIELDGGEFDIDDEGYAETVRKVLDCEIGAGRGSNFVIKRSYLTRIGGYRPVQTLGFFRRLLEREQGTYWSFVVHTGERTLVGASPERHLSLRAGRAVMNPISGTYRYPPSGPTREGLLEFLAVTKEREELAMVLDEELKMMARVCDSGGEVLGPFLKEMAKLAHTEYLIEGRCTQDPRQALRETLLAPTVTGSPLESAARVIDAYEPDGRGYYSGVLALFERDDAGESTLDSTIVIRTADIDRDGRVRIDVGASLVRHSDPAGEAAETRAKAAGLLSALTSSPQPRLADDPDVHRALRARNHHLSQFWLTGADSRPDQVAELAGRRILVIDAEDTFTEMIAHQLRSLGPAVTVCRFDQPYDVDEYDLVVAGPGPGDPRDLTDPKIAALRRLLSGLLAGARPFLAVCLSHQVLSGLLGLPVVQLDGPTQGVQRAITLFGTPVRVGFYNSFVARSTVDRFAVPSRPGSVGSAGSAGSVECSREAGSGEVYALRAAGFESVQFHFESVFSPDGVHLLRRMLTGLLGGTPQRSSPAAPVAVNPDL